MATDKDRVFEDLADRLGIEVEDAARPTFRLQVHMPESDAARCDRCEFPRRDHIDDELFCPALPTWER